MSLSKHEFIADPVAEATEAAQPTPSRPARHRFLSALRSAAAANPEQTSEPGVRGDSVVPFPLSIVRAADVAPIAPVPAPAPVYKHNQQRAKRAFDLALVAIAAPLWIPIVLMAALFIVLRDGHNPFYTQQRVGRDGRIFNMIKLRSMVPDADARLEAYLDSNPEARAEWDTTQKLKSDPRITKFGRIIRKTSIDELPQLINVIKGDMSIVGPRPFMLNQATLYRGRRYYDLRPGLTGFWQISERNDCSFESRVHFDAAYHRAMSIKTDIAVIFRTVSVVVRGTGY